MIKERNVLGPRNQAQGLWVWDSEGGVGVGVGVGEDALTMVHAQRSEVSSQFSPFTV